MGGIICHTQAQTLDNHPRNRDRGRSRRSRDRQKKKKIGRGTPHHAMKSSYYCIIFSDNKVTDTGPTRHPRHRLLPCLAYYIV
jgi:hypothetical protein